MSAVLQQQGFSATHQSALTTTLPTTKITPPPTPVVFVPRPALVARLCSVVSGHVTLVRAPTGFGKSTLLESCRRTLQDQGVATAWLNLDASDNDAVRLLHGITETFARSHQPQTRAPARRAPPTADPTAIAERLFESLECSPRSFAIFLDEFEELHDSTALRWVAELIERLPPHGALFIASRRLPDLPLSRLRACGRLNELQTSALRFTLQEAHELLNEQRQLSLTSDDITRLHERTEGWAAGLWLAALALERAGSRSDFIQHFSGSYTTVADYLAECVLARQSEPVRHFLLRTSVLKQFNPSLCEALLPGVDARTMFDKLASTDILLASLDDSGNWFRYHSMFASFLQSVLEREAPHEKAELHRRAARWYIDHERPVPAISHALSGDDPQHAVVLLRKHAQALLRQGRNRLLERWFSRLPANILKDEHWLQAMHVWSVTYTHGAHSGAALLDHYGLERCEEDEVKDCLRLLRPLLPALMDRVEESAQAGLACIAERGRLRGFADAVLLCTVASVVVNLGDHERARSLLEQARRLEGAEVSNFTILHYEITEAIIDAQEGRLRQAMAHLRLAVEAGSSGDSRHSNGNPWAGVLHACALYEHGDVDTSERLLRAHAPAIHAVGFADMMILVYRTLARIAFSRGQIDDAFLRLSELQYLGQRHVLERVVASATLERSRLLLQQGHVSAAKMELSRAGNAALWQRVKSTRLVANELDDHDITTFRWEALAGDATAAACALTPHIEAAEIAGRHYRAYKLRLLHVLAAHRSGLSDVVSAGTERLLRDTCPDHFVQLFVDEGAAAKRLLNDFACSKAGQAFSTDPLCGPYLQLLLQRFGTQGNATEPIACTEALTRKELTVLQLAADGLGDSAIADKLFLSLSTIRTHLRNIYAKLDVHSRMQAVVSARRAGLI